MNEDRGAGRLRGGEALLREWRDLGGEGGQAAAENNAAASSVRRVGMDGFSFFATRRRAMRAANMASRSSLR